MTDDFISNFRDDFGDEEGPDWIHDLDDIEEEGGGPPPVADPDEPEDEFDQLRQRSARASSAYEDVDIDDDGTSFSLSQLSPGQRLVLAVLLLLNVIVIIVGVLAMTGVL